MAIIRIDHPSIEGNEKTYLSTAAVAAASTLTVQNIEGFSVNNYLVLGKLGEEKTEIVQIHTTTAPSGTTITLAAAISFAHAINTPVILSVTIRWLFIVLLPKVEVIQKSLVRRLAIALLRH